MEQLTREQVCDKIAKLKNELATCEDLLNKIDAGEQAESEFAVKVKSMVGGYYLHNYTDSKLYCRIDSVDKIRDSNIYGPLAKCVCAAVSIPKKSKIGYRAYLDCVYIDKSDIDDYKPITKEEFDKAVAKFNEKFNSPT